MKRMKKISIFIILISILGLHINDLEAPRGGGGRGGGRGGHGGRGGGRGGRGGRGGFRHGGFRHGGYGRGGWGGYGRGYGWGWGPAVGVGLYGGYGYGRPYWDNWYDDDVIYTRPSTTYVLNDDSELYDEPVEYVSKTRTDSKQNKVHSKEVFDSSSTLKTRNE